MKLCLDNLDKKYFQPINELVASGVFESGNDGIKLDIAKSNCLNIDFDGKNCRIEISKLHELFYALMLLKSNAKPFKMKCESSLKELSFMLDCSRNKVISVPAAKKLIRLLSMLGYDCLHLYMEDTYEMDGYPYFGYMRGRFSASQLSELDEYAAMFGIELVPSIQTLAHLNCALRWNAHRDMLDLNDILLADFDKTYQFIESMLSTLSKCIKSRKINIGMDEAYLLGFGKYREIHGDVDQHKIMLEHLNRVYKLCEKYGYQPMMWADMFFRIAGDGSYEGVNQSVSLDKFKDIPSGLTPVYWDYVTSDKDRYNYYMQSLKSISNNCAFAGGAWKWAGVVPNNRFSISRTKIALDCVIENKIDRVIATAWGDDGDEGSIFSVLPTIAYYGARRFGSEDYADVLTAACNVPAELFMILDLPCFTCGNGDANFAPWRYALYQDPLCGIYDYHICEGDNKDFADIAARLKQAKASAGEYAYLFDTLQKLCEVLSVKTELGIKLRKAYKSGDKEKLKRLAEQMTALIPTVESYRKAMRNQWMTDAVGCGFEYIDIKIGGIAARLDSVADRINDYLSGKINKIDELEQELLAVEPQLNDHPDRRPVWAGAWRSVVTPGWIW